MKASTEVQKEFLQNMINSFGLTEQIELHHLIWNGDKFIIKSKVTGHESPQLDYDRMNHFIYGLGSHSKFIQP